MIFKPLLAAVEDGGLCAPALTMDVMLPVTEWLAKMVDRLLDVSEEIVDSGRGMNSTVSEKPTRARGRVSEAVPRWIGGLDDLVCETISSPAPVISPTGLCGSDRADAPNGVVGALVPLLSFAGFMIFEISWLDIAPDRR
jgi:hypothetical protein